MQNTLCMSHILKLFCINLYLVLERKQLVGNPLTFPVRASLIVDSLTALEKLLLASGSQASLTIWSAQEDRPNFSKLASLIRDLGKSKIYLDIPKEQEDELKKYL